MISFLQVENLSKNIGERVLFQNVTFGLYEGDKIGIIAPNGTGKTSFLNIISGKDIFFEGKITTKNDLKIASLPQVIEFNEEETAFDYAYPDDNAEDPLKKSETEKVLHQLRIFDFNQKMGTMSGGQIKRVALAKTLLQNADLLILDEPTNHLDVELVEWLEKYLSKSSITLIMVTHDRYFLDRVCNKIIEIDNKQLYFYEGNFNYYLQKKEEREENTLSEISKIKNILRKEREWMNRQPQARGSKAKYRIDNFYELENKAKSHSTVRDLKLSQEKNYIGNKIFEAHNISKKFGEKKILENWNYIFSRNERVGIVGENGVGKTTFIRLLLNEIKPDSGIFDIGTTVKWGYYSQEGLEKIDEDKKVIDIIRDIAENIKTPEGNIVSASQYLSKFLFPPEVQQKLIKNLSGGEKRRLNLAIVLMKKPNFLILDEPTNDLDISTLSILEDYLINFKGCVIIVSHDRFFLDRTIDHLFVMEGEGVIKDFPGNYTDYRRFLEVKEKEKKTEEKEKIHKNENLRPKERERKLTFKEKKEYEELQNKIEILYKEKEESEAKLSNGITDHEELRKISERHRVLTEEIDNIEMRLLELMELGAK